MESRGEKLEIFPLTFRGNDIFHFITSEGGKYVRANLTFLFFWLSPNSLKIFYGGY